MTDDEHPRTKAAIIARNSTARTAFESALARLDEEALLAPRALGDWSLRDVMSHIGSTWLLEQLESLLEGRDPQALAAWGTEDPPGPEFDMATNDGRNAWQQQVRRHESLDQVRERLRRLLDRMDRVIETLPPEEFERPYTLRYTDFVGTVRPAEDGEQGYPLWQWIRGEYWHHLEDHLPAFEEAARSRDRKMGS